MVLLYCSPSNTYLIKVCHETHLMLHTFWYQIQSWFCWIFSLCLSSHTRKNLQPQYKVITMDDTVPVLRVFYLIVRLWGWKMRVKSERCGNTSIYFVAYCWVSILLLYLCQICRHVFLAGCSWFYVFLVPIVYLQTFHSVYFLIVTQKINMYVRLLLDLTEMCVTWFMSFNLEPYGHVQN